MYAGIEAQTWKFYELVDENNIEDLSMHFTVDAIYHRPGYDALIAQDAIVKFYRYYRIIKEGVHKLESAMVGECGVAARGSFSGVLRDGRSIQLRFADFFAVAPGPQYSRRDTFFLRR
ncbi:nuclear transport factor 2 family protein [Nocardia sp. NPDC060256]|uniref:nuclear transport factor 2 family protein n=1 Tax=unclassified Nocardia TaxID=2637762 RepID=UPI003661571B